MRIKKSNYNGLKQTYSKSGVHIDTKKQIKTHLTGHWLPVSDTRKRKGIYSVVSQNNHTIDWDKEVLFYRRTPANKTEGIIKYHHYQILWSINGSGSANFLLPIKN